MAKFFCSDARDLGLTPVRARVLHAIGELQPCRQRQVATAMAMSAQQAAVLIDTLVERDLVERAPDPSDRRAVAVTLTPKGQSTVSAIDDMRVRIAGQVFGSMGVGERNVATQLLRPLCQSVQSLSGKPVNG